jgi:hypothetical protein
LTKNLTYQFINESISKVRDLGSENIGRICGTFRGGDNQINESFIRHVESVSKQIKPKRLNLKRILINQNNYFQLSIIPLDNLAGEMPEDVCNQKHYATKNCMSWNLKVILIILSFGRSDRKRGRY